MPPPLPTFPSKGKMGRKGLTSSHWPQVDATALRREGRTQEKPQVSLLVKGKGRGSLPGVPLASTPPPCPDPAGIAGGSPSPSGRPPRLRGCSSSGSSFLAAATVVWPRRSEAMARSGVHDAGGGRVPLGSAVRAPDQASGGNREGTPRPRSPQPPALWLLNPFGASPLLLGHLSPKSEGERGFGREGGFLGRRRWGGVRSKRQKQS